MMIVKAMNMRNFKCETVKDVDRYFSKWGEYKSSNFKSYLDDKNYKKCALIIKNTIRERGDNALGRTMKAHLEKCHALLMKRANKRTVIPEYKVFTYRSVI